MKYVIRKVPERNTLYLERLLPDALIVNDERHNGCIWSFLKAIEVADDDAIYIQDDMLLCKDFVIRAEEYMSLHRNEIVIFSTPFLKGKKEYNGDKIIEKEGYYEPAEAFWQLCTYIPKCISQKFLQFWLTGEYKTVSACNKYLKMQADDLFFRRFLERYEYGKVFVTVPNLAGHEENKSVVCQSRPKRISPMFNYNEAEAKFEGEK